MNTWATYPPSENPRRSSCERPSALTKSAAWSAIASTVRGVSPLELERLVKEDHRSVFCESVGDGGSQWSKPPRKCCMNRSGTPVFCPKRRYVKRMRFASTNSVKPSRVYVSSGFFSGTTQCFSTRAAQVCARFGRDEVNHDVDVGTRGFAIRHVWCATSTSAWATSCSKPRLTLRRAWSAASCAEVHFCVNGRLERESDLHFPSR